MWIDDNKDMKDLVRKTGSPYAACIYAAKKGRQLQQSVNNVISESESLSWAISGRIPKDLERRIQAKLQNTEEISESTKLGDILSTIEEDNIRVAVLNSYRTSVRMKQLVFDYNGIKDRGIRTRIRILVRMVFLS